MFLRSRKPYLTCITALCATASFTALLLFAGIAAACSGEWPPPECGGPPIATTEFASPTETSAWLYGSVNSRNCAGTTYTFKYGKTTAYGSEVSGTVEQSEFTEPLQNFISGLSPHTLYHFQLYATNSEGTDPGGDVTFETTSSPPPPPPTVTTEAATGVSSYGATLNALVNPNGSATSYKFEYGTKEKELNQSTTLKTDLTGSTSQKVSASLSVEPGTKYYFRISATNSGGTKTGSELNFTASSSSWSIKSTPNPEGATDTELYDDSCEPSTSACTAVGKSTVSGADRPIALRWNSLSWSEQTTAKKSGTLPTRLFGVDCPSETRCLAAGNYQPSEGGATLLTEIWNEGKWAVQTTPVPSESTSSELVAIGCNNTAECTAAGSAVIGGVKKAIIEEWNSPTWTLATVPIPEGAKSSQLDGVDCLFSNLCVAVGRYTSNLGTVKNLVEFWNGTEWSLQTATEPVGAAESYLLDVSCSTPPNRCSAVGSWKNSANEHVTLAYRFNGSTTWTLESTPNAPGSTSSVLQDISCATETSCTAVGSRGSTKTLAETWNGTSWSIQGTPNPSGSASSSLSGVACRSTTCMGVGWGTSSSGVDTTLSEFRE
jgi:hypothetical protein